MQTYACSKAIIFRVPNNVFPLNNMATVVIFTETKMEKQSGKQNLVQKWFEPIVVGAVQCVWILHAYCWVKIFLYPVFEYYRFNYPVEFFEYLLERGNTYNFLNLGKPYM